MKQEIRVDYFNIICSKHNAGLIDDKTLYVLLGNLIISETMPLNIENQMRKILNLEELEAA